MIFIFYQPFFGNNNSNNLIWAMPNNNNNFIVYWYKTKLNQINIIGIRITNVLTITNNRTK